MDFFPVTCGFPGTLPAMALPWMQWQCTLSFLRPSRLLISLFLTPSTATGSRGLLRAPHADRTCVVPRWSAKRALGHYTSACSFLCLGKILASLLVWRSKQIEEALKLDFFSILAKESVARASSCLPSSINATNAIYPFLGNIAADWKDGSCCRTQRPGGMLRVYF